MCPESVKKADLGHIFCGQAIIMRKHLRPYGFVSLPFGKFARILIFSYRGP